LIPTDTFYWYHVPSPESGQSWMCVRSINSVCFICFSIGY